MRIGDRIAGTAFVVLAIAVIVLAAQLPQVPGLAFGPGLFPTLIGIGMAVAGAILAVKDWRNRPRSAPIDLSVWLGRPRAATAAVWAVVGMACAALLFSSVGFPLVAVAYAMPLMLLMGARPGGALVTSFLIVGIAYYVMTRVFFVPLPVGPLGFLG